MSEAKYVHFTIGEDFGKTIVNIAHEKLYCDYNPVKAIQAITESLMGCSKELALQIIKGDYMLCVNVDSQDCYLTERDVNDTEYPFIDVYEWYENKSKDIIRKGKLIKGMIEQIMSGVKDRLIINVDFKDIIKYINTDNAEDLIYGLTSNVEVERLTSCIEVSKKFITDTILCEGTMNWLRFTYPDSFKDKALHEEREPILMFVQNRLTQLLKSDFDEFEKEYEDVKKFCDASIAIEKVLSKGIEPVDIMSNYDAGWLSPEGVYYALNGEIANMLHLQIADALQEIGVIPNNEDIVCKDAWLEQKGWVKIHDNNINFAGNLNSRIGLKNVNMTQIQVDMIYNYIQTHHNCIMRCGWKLEKISAAKFQMFYENNVDKLNELYFDF